MHKQLFSYAQSAEQRRRSRRRGSVILYVALGLTAFIGTAALSVDIGNLYSRRARAQLAADAAALAGAYEMANYRSANANVAAIAMARRNGYDSTVTGVTVTVTSPVPGEPNRVQVRTSRNEPLFFARIFGFVTRPVSATATAEFSTEAPLSINGGGPYGTVNGPTTLTVYGPDARFDFGDYRSVKKLVNGQNNPYYDGIGYNFTVNVPAQYPDGSTLTTVEIFDPDCHNLNNSLYVQAGVRVDELREPSPQAERAGGSPANATTTKYTLYWDPQGTGNPAQLQKIGEQSWGDDATTDMKWVPAFTFDRTSYPGGNFLLNVTTTAGSSENGYSLRAGPPRTSAQTFDPNNGTSITADGHLPINFVQNGTAPFTMGYVPPEMAGKTMTIRKFDTDVGSQSVNYTYVAADSSVSAPIVGQLSGDGTFATDTITLPLNYPGGTWRADYRAGANDTSVWEMTFSGGVPGKPGRIKLVK